MVNIYEEIDKKVENLYKEKNEFKLCKNKLSKENDELKVKFSKLLDQFQEYVNDTEVKMQKD